MVNLFSPSVVCECIHKVSGHGRAYEYYIDLKGFRLLQDTASTGIGPLQVVPVVELRPGAAAEEQVCFT